MEKEELKVLIGKQVELEGQEEKYKKIAKEILDRLDYKFGGLKDADYKEVESMIIKVISAHL